MLTSLIIIVVLTSIVGLVWFGYRLACRHLQAARAHLEQQHQALRVQWQALESARRVNDVYFQAREEMRRAEGVSDGDIVEDKSTSWRRWSR